MAAGTCFDKAASQQTSEIMRIVHFNTSFHCTTKYKARITSDISFIIYLPPPLFSVSLGGSEDYRQNPAESHQSTEGESLFYGHMATLMSWLQCSWLFH